MNASDSRIRMLQEDNEELIKELKNKSRSLEEAEDLVKRLKKQKNEWQELYLQVAPGKRPAEAVGSDPLSDKRSRRDERGEQSRQSSSMETGASNHRERSRWDLVKVRRERERSTVTTCRVAP